MDKVIKEGTLRLQTTESTCDIILSCNGQRLMAHKLILSIASPVFREILQKDPDSTIIILPETDPLSMTSVLDYIYTGTTIVGSKNLQDFLSLVNFFRIELDKKYLERFLDEKKEILKDIEVKKKEEDVNFTKDLVNNNVFLDNKDIFGKRRTQALLEDDKTLVKNDEVQGFVTKPKIIQTLNKSPKNNKIDFTAKLTLSSTKTRRKPPKLLPLSNFSKTGHPVKIKPSNLIIPTIPSPWCPRIGEVFMEDPRKVYLRNLENDTPHFQKTQPQEDNNNNTPAFASYPHQTASRYIPSKLNNVIRSLYLSNNTPETTKDTTKTTDVRNCSVATNFDLIKKSKSITDQNLSEKNEFETKKSSERVLKSLLSTKKNKKLIISECTSTVTSSTNNVSGSDSKFLNNSENSEPSTLNKTGFDANDYPINLTQNVTRFLEDKNALVTKRPIKIDTATESAYIEDRSFDSGQDSDSLDTTINSGESLNKELESKGGDGNKTFGRRRGSVEGNEVKDGKKKVFECTDCKKCFSQLRNYKYHRSLHDGTKEFSAKCPECGKTFNDKGYLSSHMKIHRDKKEYACPSCPKRFNQRVAYNMHMRIHTGLKPHQCATCGKSFSRKMLLKQHQRVHTGERPYSCPECGKTFADRSNMSLHARLHTGVKPYACDLCPKSFTKKHHLKTHMNFHTGLKPYVCKNCDLAFSQSSNMRTHYKKCVLRKGGEGGSLSAEENTA